MPRLAPYWPKSFTADGVGKEYTIGFPFLSQDHLRVIKNGVLMVVDTDYSIQDPTSADAAVLKFVNVPTNGHVIKVYRNTPVEKYRGNPNIGNVDGLQAFYRSQERADERVRLPFYRDETQTLAGTAASLVAPCDGYIELLQTEITKAITTGGAVTVEIDGVAVTGLSITVADAAPIGLIQQDTPTTAQSATTKVRKGQTITVTPAAAFATAGSFRGFVELQPADL